MLPARAAEAIERVACDVVAARDRNFLDRLRHFRDRDGDEAVGDLLGPAPVADLRGQRREGLANGVGVERLILTRAKDFGEEIRDQLAHHQIGVGDGERAAAAIALRAGIGARRVRPDAEARAVEMQDRAAARRDRVDAHHRRAHPDARDLGLERAFVFAVEMRDVGGRAAHVEADHAIEAGAFPGARHRDHAARRPERIASLPANRSAEVRPPEDIMNISRAPVRATSSSAPMRAT